MLNRYQFYCVLILHLQQPAEAGMLGSAGRWTRGTKHCAGGPRCTTRAAAAPLAQRLRGGAAGMWRTVRAEADSEKPNGREPRGQAGVLLHRLGSWKSGSDSNLRHGRGPPGLGLGLAALPFPRRARGPGRGRRSGASRAARGCFGMRRAVIDHQAGPTLPSAGGTLYPSPAIYAVQRIMICWRLALL